MNSQSGQILILTIVVVGLVLINTLLIIAGATTFFNNASYTVMSDQALALAEAGVDKAIASLNATAGAYTGEEETFLGQGSYSVSITTPQNNMRVIEVTGYIPSKANPKVKRTIQVTAAKGEGISFNYGALVGEGGLEMNNNSIVTAESGAGSVYSNGNVIMSNGARITGDLIVAGGVAATPDQETECLSNSCQDFIFGKNVDGQNQLDVAQSFTPSVTNTLNKVSIKIRKVGNPPDVIVRILRDNNGKPNKNQVLTSSTLYSGMVTSSFPSFVDISFSNPPMLQAGNVYWIMVDTSANNNNYWIWENDTTSGYTRGFSSWSANWQASNPIWNTIGGDLSFRTYMGGNPTYVQGTTGARVLGNVRANTIRDLTIYGEAYYQAQENITVGGSPCTNNPKCHPGSEDPGPGQMPISDALIQEWKNSSEEEGIYTGNISSCVSTIGPGKYTGSINFSNGCNVVARTPIWIVGNLTLSNNNRISLDSSYGSDSGVIIVDGRVQFSNNNTVQGSGDPNSQLIIISTYDSQITPAITFSNTGNTGIVYAPRGIIDISNGNRLEQITGWKLRLANNVVVEYKSGLASLFISSGPGGEFSLIKGTYQIK